MQKVSEGCTFDELPKKGAEMCCKIVLHFVGSTRKFRILYPPEFIYSCPEIETSAVTSATCSSRNLMKHSGDQCIEQMKCQEIRESCIARNFLTYTRRQV
jgi:hypothetical protein